MFFGLLGPKDILDKNFRSISAERIAFSDALATVHAAAQDYEKEVLREVEEDE